MGRLSIFCFGRSVGMYCQAYIKKDRLYVNFNQMSIVYDGLNFQLGNAATDFAALPEAVYLFVFEQLENAFLKLVSHGMNYDNTFVTLKELVVATSMVNPYFNFYMDNFIMYLMCLHELEHRFSIPVLMRTFLIDGGKDVDLSGTDVVNQRRAAKAGREIFIADLIKRQNRLKEDFESITSSAAEFTELSSMQRLYLLSMQGRNYLSGKFQMTLAPDYQNMPEGDLDKIKSTLLEHKVDVVEMVDIDTLDDLLSYELYHTLKSDLLLRKCKFCGEFFIVRGRIDMEYCERVKKGESKPCSLIGATRSYWGSKADDPIHVAFQKAYKRNHSRQRVGKMTQTEFYEWSEEARQKRGECEAGRLSLDEFTAWLGNKG